MYVCVYAGVRGVHVRALCFYVRVCVLMPVGHVSIFIHCYAHACVHERMHVLVSAHGHVQRLLIV